MSKSHFHTINAKDILSEIFMLSKKEQREFALNLLIDLAKDDVELATSDIAKAIILKTGAFRAKLSTAGSKGQQAKKEHINAVLDVEPAWMDESN